MKKIKSLVIGCGKLGANISDYLSKKGDDVIIVDQDSRSFRKLDVNFSGYKLIGDATDLDFLENQCDITHINQIVITTNSDSVNLYVSHVAYFIYQIPNIYVRFIDVDKGLLIKKTNIKASYPFDLSMKEFLDLEAKK
ncbi:MAG: NAD-binding protein [Bacilli bacterium]|jgi:trk system potassium uptake protein TrkA|nr:TrkA family potassium uptake protein [Erysipelotrichia bacterium]